jgi:hypothetical protein
VSRRPPPPVGDDNPVTPPRPVPPRRAPVDAAMVQEAVASTHLDGDTIDVGPVTVHGKESPDEHAARSIRDYYGGKPDPLTDGVTPASDREVVETLTEAGPDPDAIIAGLIKLRTKQVDPMTDWVGDGTRMPRWVQAAIAHEADLTPRTRQEIVRDALLGIRPLSEELLNLHYRALYGRDRHA